MSKSKDNQYIKYFYGFNGLRFIAAMLVVIHHAEQIRKTNGLSHLKQYSFAQNGSLAVDFFFVLSGFLITYLLLVEKDTKQKISIRNFYIRRILRIWPLYYLLVLLGLFIVPTALHLLGKEYTLPFDSTTGWLLYVFFLPNAISVMFPPTGNLIYSLWSIGVEEQFYIIWAPLFRFFYRQILYILIGIIVIKVGLNERLAALAQTNESLIFWAKFVGTIKFELMSIGGLGALLLFRKGTKFLEQSIIFKPYFQVICLGILLVHFLGRAYIYSLDNTFSSIYSGIFQSKFSALLLSVLYLWLLLNTALNPRAILSFRNKWINQLGEISYGIYMYHITIIYVIITFIKKWLPENIFFSELIFYGIALPCVFLCSHLSYHFFEKKILGFKHKLQKE